MPKQKREIIQYSSDEESSSEGSAAEFSQIEDSETEQHMQDEEYTSDGDSASDSEDDDEEESKADRVRKQLADVPFSQLIRIQQQMGTQRFNKQMGMKERSQTKEEVKRALKQQLRPESAGDSDSESDDSDSGPETVSTAKSGSGKNNLGRDSKKMPTVVTSKRPVSRLRQVVDIPKAKTRDPRFDSLSGNFNEGMFDKAYSFLETQQQEEIESLKEQAKKLKNKNPEEARRIQLVVSSMQSQIAAKKKKRHVQELKRAHKKSEIEAVKQGKRPYFLKKRDLKTLELAEKFTKLKDSSKLDNFLEKRRKRNATKEHRSMPYAKRQD
ncbi:rRNA biogenesis protein rrp36 [Dipsacomyces acuminosporus]|nr:rRNA biogenesis protein rrp36 [Dipsacomyces acuminosporus]